MNSPGGEGSDGRGTSGMAEEKTREARPGETGTTRFGMEEEGDDSDGAGSRGMIDEKGGELGGGLESGLQRGGTVPGGGPGTSTGAIGTGGGSTANEDSGSLERWNDGELDESKR